MPQTYRGPRHCGRVTFELQAYEDGQAFGEHREEAAKALYSRQRKQPAA